jgi:hypothetical protein
MEWRPRTSRQCFNEKSNAILLKRWKSITEKARNIEPQYQRSSDIVVATLVEGVQTRHEGNEDTFTTQQPEKVVLGSITPKSNKKRSKKKSRTDTPVPEVQWSPILILLVLRVQQRFKNIKEESIYIILT